MRTRLTAGILGWALFFCSPSVWGSDMARAATDEIERLRADLGELEKQPGKKAAVGELAVAWRWLKEGEVLLKEGRANKAAVLAERLQFQVQLIRVLMAAQKVWEKIELAGKELAEAQKELDALRARHDRLLLRLHGGRLTGATPQGEDRQ